MKKWCFFLLIIVPLASAENFDKYNDLTLIFEVSSGLDLIYGGNSKLELLSADLKLFPQNNKNQQVLDINTFSSPQAKIEEDGDITYLWNELYDTYIFGLKSKVKVNNQITKISSKIRFPYDFGMEFSEYLSQSEFIDINSDIRDKANEILIGEDDYYNAVFKLSSWIKDNIEYDLNTITANAVQKSSWVLENKQGVCDELTNLFISMLRSVGIPARFVTGMVYTNLEENWGNHGWAEVYFPNEGWVSWDVTFAQFGWIDPSHIKLGDAVDSGESSVEYKWKSRDVEVENRGLSLKTILFEDGELLEPLVKLNVRPLYERIKFGSYLPIAVTVENLNDYYLSDNIILTKAPRVDENVKTILLKPREIKTVYWISKVPTDLDDSYVYTSLLEVKDAFASSSKSEVFYVSDGEEIGFDEASLLITDFEVREEKEPLRDVNIVCSFEDRSYHSDEKIDILCKVRNNGNTQLGNLNFCLDETCFNDNLGIGEVKEFKYELNSKESALFVVESESFIEKENLKFSVIHTPNIYVTDLNPGLVDYGTDTEINFYLNSDFEARDVVIDITGIGEIRYDVLLGKEFVKFNVNSKRLTSGLNLAISYRDSEGKEYKDSKSYPIIVRNTPFYAKWLALFRGVTS